MIARQTLNIYIQYLKNLPRLRGYSLVHIYIHSIYHSDFTSYALLTILLVIHFIVADKE